MNQIKWSEIEAECGNFRAGFVATFRKYEGQTTDETDAYGRPVKVTAASFSRHIGVHEDTFRRWVKMTGSARVMSQPRTGRALQRDVLRASRHAPESVVDGIMDAPEATQDRIFHELKLRRAGIDTSEANRKAAKASAAEQTEPIRRGLELMGLALYVHQLEDVAEGLRQANEDGPIPANVLDQIKKAHAAIAEEIAVAEFKVEVDR